MATEVILATTELDALPNNNRKLLSEVDNSVSPKGFIDIRLTLGEIAQARAINACVDVYLIPSMNGVDYLLGESVDPSINMFLSSMNFRDTINSETDIIMFQRIPVGKFKLLLKNRTGEPLSATGNILSYRIYG